MGDSAFNRADKIIRPLQFSDLEAVNGIELTGYSHPWPDAVFRDCFRDDYRLWALENSDQRLIGYAIVAYLFDEAHLLNICVAKTKRGQGAGRMLLAHLAREAFDEKMSVVTLEVRLSNHSAIALYESFGFERMGLRPGYYPGDTLREDALVLTLRAPG
ncbi:MAG: ribosomal-protein-alanine N-acetyltransferase [Alteromonadaceae bacterium]|nr:ribosomal-protein-alanine N-acetyltransferase [Alteromonadaceae bacterium]MBH84715.1 ribosomal-protein-alanine N-acetyltransferase [Alteromonadaceae bacterium]|tara:strand:- start:23002 stop:23478 length:477 start_codon:yes stop_codon:yes gene_type:complete